MVEGCYRVGVVRASKALGCLVLVGGPAPHHIIDLVVWAVGSPDGPDHDGDSTYHQDDGDSCAVENAIDVHALGVPHHG